MLRLPLLIISLVILSSCAIAPPDPHVQEAGGLTVMSTTADVQGLMIKDRSSQKQMCAGRMVEASDTANYSLGVSQLSTSESAGAGTGIVTLGGLNPAVHMTSELMYRACELTLNLNLDDDQSAKLFETFLAAAVNISSHYQSSNATSSLVSAPSYMKDVKPTAKSIIPSDASGVISTDSTDAASDPTDSADTDGALSG
jgi:hypothetical protein